MHNICLYQTKFINVNFSKKLQALRQWEIN